MKFSKHLLALAAILSFAGAASAAGLDGVAFSGDAHANSSLVHRGLDVSNKKLSVGATARVDHASGVFGSADVNTAKFANPYTGELGSGQSFNQFNLGYGAEVAPGLNVTSGFTYNNFSGNQDAGQLSTSEVFSAASYQGFTGKLAYTVHGGGVNTPGYRAGDVYGELGYTYTIDKVSAGADIGYTWYADKGQFAGAKDGMNFSRIRIDYALTKEVTVGLAHQIDGQGYNGVDRSANHRTTAAVSYKF